LYRLTRVGYNPPTLNALPVTNFISYRYDRIGNMLGQNSDMVHQEKGVSLTDLGAMVYGGGAGRFGRTGRAPNDPPGPHAITSITPSSTNNPAAAYTYDANGNMTIVDGLTNTWDFKDRLVTTEDSTMIAQYTYDHADRRVSKRVNYKPSNTNSSAT